MTMSAIHVAIENVSRRGFLRGMLATGGLILAAEFVPGRAALAYATGAAKFPGGVVADPHVFVSIDPSGIVTIIAHRAEMGTGSRTSLPMVVADELDADWAKVKVRQSPGDEKKYGNQNTDGSRSMRHFIQPMRQCGAAARRMLEIAAAARWNVDIAEVEAKNHEIIHKPSGRKLGYGDLAAAASALPTPPPDQIKLKDEAAFRYLGKGNVQIVDLFDITTGRAGYGIDARLPGMKYAVVARPPVLGGKLVSHNATAAMKVPGVEKVVVIDGTPPPSKFQPIGGVAVIAANTWAAIRGRDALVLHWDGGAHDGYDSAAYKAQLEETAGKPGKVVRNDGDAEQALTTAAKTVSAQYYVPNLAHAPMEPPNATARLADGKCEVWAPVQSPGEVQDELVDKFKLKREDVTVNVTLLGGGFGRKSKCDYVLEAALLSQAMDGAPVKLVWTREDDLHNDYFHAPSFERLDAGIDGQGHVVAWRHRVVAPTIRSIFVADPKREQAGELSQGVIDVPFAIPNLRCEAGEAEAHSRIGWFRSVRNIPHAFAVQSFVAEIAHTLGRDPKDMLLELIGPPRIFDPRKSQGAAGYTNYGEPFETFPFDTGRLRRVVEVVAEQAGWGRQLPAGHGLGIAAHRSFVSYAATVVEVAVDNKGKFTVPRVDTAIDCGFAANPERIRSQIEGAAVMGLAIAKYGEITFKNGRAQQNNFDGFQVARIDESPVITHVHIIPASIKVPASGVGEPGLPPFAPALCNAIFAATGKRIRQLPIGDQLAS
ncbi:MAG: xanthine dehydrogenase family protein molybdopterin-binding subunit [Alphaproteobacteria bacterium]|nr:xanthine dehydrogenase family protein molybdopterin-binding subunit [Alphaproteobacteria bacterium]